MKKRMKAFPAMAWRITALVMAMWLFAMILLTWAVAADFQFQVKNQAWDYAWMSHGGVEDRKHNEPVDLIRLMGRYYYGIDVEKLLPFVIEQTPHTVYSQGWFWGHWGLYYGFEGAEAFYDENGELLVDSGSYLTFTYTTQEAWSAGKVESMGSGYIDLDEIPEAKEHIDDLILDFPYGDFSGGVFSYVLRMTGHFEGTEFQPVQIHRGRYFDSSGEVENPVLFQQFDARDQVQWEELLNTETSADEELVTIYTWENQGILKEHTEVGTGSNTYPSLTELLKASQAGEEGLEKDSLLESITISRGRKNDTDYVIALRYWPIQYAMLRLWHVYLITLAVAAFLLRMVLSKLLTSFTRPVADLAEALEKGMGITPDASWPELRSLEEHFVQSRQTQAEAKTEIQQLRTALDYAKNAEENRRQLVSNITHELKTPLAVIHSYAEGLQAGIAGEKRDAYLDTILGEAERMDAMVLQMLDLSRLEAGKVRLTMSQFSLLKLTRSVAAKLKPMLEAKELEMNEDFVEDFLLTADEGRMEQVITNLLTNALKYTSTGGQIGVKIYTHKRTARFLIENTSPHLSDDALEKVFDSFYRADPGRTEHGTGLGLTLVKSIVELHQGSCTVRNTTYRTEGEIKTAVEFGFILPMA